MDGVLLSIPAVRTVFARDLVMPYTDFIIAIGAGTGDWAAAYAQARAIVAQATNEEKQNVSIGYYGASNGCSGVYQTRVIMLSRPYSYCN